MGTYVGGEAKMAWQRVVVEIGMGTDIRGADYTKAAVRALRDALWHNSLTVAGALGRDADSMRVEVHIGVPRPERVDEGTWLLFMDGTGLGRDLRRHLQSRGQRVIQAAHGDDYARISPDEFVINPRRREDMENLIEALQHSANGLTGIVHCWSADAPPPSEISAATLDAAQDLGCLSVIHLIQTLIATPFSTSPRLWLITAGAQSLHPGKDRLAIAQAPLWGYRIDGEPLGLAVCHCKGCQQQSGSAFGMSLAVGAESFHLLSGELGKFATPCDSGRTKVCAFCPRCGTRIYHGDGDPELSLKPGTLDDTSWLEPEDHYWTACRQRWFSIPAGVACYEDDG